MDVIFCTRDIGVDREVAISEIPNENVSSNEVIRSTFETFISLSIIGTKLCAYPTSTKQAGAQAQYIRPRWMSQTLESLLPIATTVSALSDVQSGMKGPA